VSSAKAPVSVCIVARNEADRLEPCLQSVAWADQIVLLDLESTDDTASIARDAGAEVHSHEPFPVVEPLRNVVAAHARHDWVLALDPDERVADELAVRLAEVVAGDDFDAVEIPVMNFDLGYPATHSALRHDHKPRLYRRARRATRPAARGARRVVDRPRSKPQRRRGGRADHSLRAGSGAVDDRRR
jgi:glycosyltransferase involved in cell wall biosynthesis